MNRIYAFFAVVMIHCGSTAVAADAPFVHSNLHYEIIVKNGNKQIFTIIGQLRPRASSVDVSQIPGARFADCDSLRPPADCMRRPPSGYKFITTISPVDDSKAMVDLTAYVRLDETWRAKQSGDKMFYTPTSEEIEFNQSFEVTYGKPVVIDTLTQTRKDGNSEIAFWMTVWKPTGQ